MFSSTASDESRLPVAKRAIGMDRSDANRHRRPFGGELSRVLSAAVISPKFERILLSDPDRALTEGYCGELFELSSGEREIVLSIRASTLQEFALELRNRSLPRQPEDPSESNRSRGTWVTAAQHRRKTSEVDETVQGF